MLLSPIFRAREKEGSEIRAKHYHDHKQQQQQLSKVRLRTYCPALYTSSCASEVNPTITLKKTNNETKTKQDPSSQPNKRSQAFSSSIEFVRKSLIPQISSLDYPPRQGSQAEHLRSFESKMNGLKENQVILTAQQ